MFDHHLQDEQQREAFTRWHEQQQANEMQWVMRCGSDIVLGDDMGAKIDGEFWADALKPPEITP